MSTFETAAVAEKPADKTVTIIVDGAPHVVTKGKITYSQVVELAFPNADPQTTYAITYKRGPNEKPEGTLSPGGSVEVKEGMTFFVSPTGQS